LSSQSDLDRAVRFFNGKSLRPNDARCPRMVCRVRRKDDDLRAGVGAQRGTGMHREWIKTREDQPKTGEGLRSAGSVEPPSPAVLEEVPEGEGRRRESIAEVVDARHASTNSMASTNSSFLVRHFPKRYFILKSLTTVSRRCYCLLTIRLNSRIVSGLGHGRRKGTTSRFSVCHRE
jgi:hypothetical protein